MIKKYRFTLLYSDEIITQPINYENTNTTKLNEIREIYVLFDILMLSLIPNKYFHIIILRINS